MKKYVVISVNENPDYIFYVPLVKWAWKKLGWETMIFYSPEFDQELFKGYRSDTLAQISRLYAACLLPKDAMIMTSDTDMIPLSDYWHPYESAINVYGHDLTNFQHIPICYIAMMGDMWLEVMNLEQTTDFQKFIKRDLEILPNANGNNPDAEKRWVVDQDLITDRLLSKKQFWSHLHKIKRGVYKNGYPIGRVDRSAWNLDHEQFIDAHLFRNPSQDDNLVKIMSLLHRVWPQEDFMWFLDHVKEFKKTFKR